MLLPKGRIAAKGHKTTKARRYSPSTNVVEPAPVMTPNKHQEPLINLDTIRDIDNLKINIDKDTDTIVSQDSAPRELRRELINWQYTSEIEVKEPGFHNVGDPENLMARLASVGYQCLPYFAVQMSLILNTPSLRIRGVILEGPSGCGKSFMAKCLAKITGAELMCLSCYRGMNTQHLVEVPSTLGMAKAMALSGNVKAEEIMNLGVISRAFLKSQTKPVILLIDELDKPDEGIDTFFLGPLQDARIWTESRPPIDADPNNLLILFTKNFNRKIDDALMRRCHPIRMTYLDSSLEKKILSPHCHPILVNNLVELAERIRNSDGSYEFERPPAPEELLTAAHYINQLLDWNIKDFSFVGRTIWAIVAKSEHDRAVLEHMLRFHHDFMDPLVPDSRNAPLEEIHARLGRYLLRELVDDPLAERREEAWADLEYN